MRFKVGDKVRVRKDLEAGKRYYMDDKKASDIFMFGMKEFLGEIVTIIGLFSRCTKSKALNMFGQTKCLNLCVITRS